jgi:glycolate oxidase FAD binding subunit
VVIGLEVVTGAGDVVRGGGRVVKNVAGFDLTRLMVGAWGTLGIITEVSVRLRGLPERDVSVTISIPAGHAQLAELLTRLRAAPIAPIALELIDGTLARQLGIGGESVLLARVTGNDESVSAQREALAGFGDVIDTDARVWTRLRTAEPASASVVRFSGPAGRLADTWSTAARVTGATTGAFAHASVLRPVARVVVPNENGTLPQPAVDALRATGRDVRIFERLPASAWPTLAPTAVNDRLSRGIRAAFDPERLLNPGILGEGAA